MPITTLSTASAFNSGADLWICPPSHQSRIAPRLDWHLNFQFAKAKEHQPRQSLPALNKILQRTGLEHSTPHPRDESTSSSLLIHSSHLLPNRWTLQLAFAGDSRKWIQEILTAWTGLQKPSLRIFLPTGLSLSDFNAAWTQTQTFDDFTIVLD